MQLSTEAMSKRGDKLGYDRDCVKTGVVHFGVGNFHRAHQAIYCDDLLKNGGTDWGITGVSLRSDSVQQALKPQDYLYTLTTLGETVEYRVVGSIKNILVAPSNPQAVIDLIGHSNTQLISSTITEKGYYLSSGRIDFDADHLKADIGSLTAPKTIYGFIAAGIIRRSMSNDENTKLTVLCCDNISNGGAWIKKGVQHLLGLHDAKASYWAKSNVTFISSMVDRVSPETRDALRERVRLETQYSDAWPVSAEPYCQWIIEDRFASVRPRFDTVGAVFVEDIMLFEQMKLRYLNAAHTIVSTLGDLSGDTYVHEAMKRSEISNFVRKVLTESILPNTTVPKGQDGHAYIQAVLDRFHNDSLPYANLQVGSDSSQKIQQRWFPTIDASLQEKRDTSHFEFCLGAWVVFIKMNIKSNTLNDPKTARFSSVKTDDTKQLVLDYLKIANADMFHFYSAGDFIDNITQHVINIDKYGLKQSLENIFV